MATTTQPRETMTREKPWHDYDAEAYVLSGELKRPIDQKIEKQALVTLNDRRGGLRTRAVEDVSIEGLVSFKNGLSRVSGSRSLKDNGWVTLSTSIVEGLNVFEIITADRIVSQASTDHPYVDGHVPRVTFIGTQFVHLRVGGFEVNPRLNLGIFGKKPDRDRSYLDDADFLKAIRAQTERIAKADGLPKEVKETYDKRLEGIDAIIKNRNGDGKDSPLRTVTCSLVENIAGEIRIPGAMAFGHVLVVPEFGAVSLGEVMVAEKRYEDSERKTLYFETSVIKMDLGCVGQGALQVATTATNGHGHP